MQFQGNVENVQLRQIAWQDERFRTSYFVDLSPLKESIKAVGLLTLPLLQKITPDRFRIISGRRRLLALKELGRLSTPATILQEKVPEVALFLLVLHENLSIRSFNLMEKANILLHLKEDFHVPEEKILRSYLPLLGLGNHPRWFNWAVRLTTFSERLQEAFAREKLSFEWIDFLAKLAPADQESVFDLLEKLQLGKNRQKELVLLLDDLLRIKKISFRDFVHQQEIAPLLADGKLTRSQKTNRFFAWLKSQRFPNYARAVNRFEELVRSLGLPSTVQIKHSPYFEEEWISVRIEFRNRAQFNEGLAVLQQLSEGKKVEELVQLTTQWREA